MQTQDYEVLQHAHDWSAGGQAAWLCTIVETLGSAPRPVGSMMTCTRDGLQAGSVSGGCVEEDLLERLSTGEFDSDLPRVIEYGVTAEENERLGLPCGGRIKLLLQAIADRDRHWLSEVLKALDKRQCIQRELSLDDGATSLAAVERHAPLSLDDSALLQRFGPRMRILLVGAGQLAHTLAELALAMDYEVLVTDTRQAIIEQWEGPDVPLLQGMPDDIVRAHARDRHSIIITLTHDPRIDDMALMEALTTDAWYVGALGSSRTTAKRLPRLRQLDLTEEQIERLHAPVGLDIGSKTPIEIAIAIMGELTQLRSREAKA